MNKYAIIDLETTGHTPSKGDRIIEIGLVLMEDNQIVAEFASFVNPQVEIPAFISNLTGIKQKDVEHAPLFSQLAGDILNHMEGAYIVAHNIPFDMGFLNWELEKAGYEPLKQPQLDTVELARILLPQSPGFKLGQLSDHLDINHDSPHRALSDAQVTADLLRQLLKKIEFLPYETVVMLLELEQGLKSDLNQLLEERENKLAFHHTTHQDFDVHRGIVLKRQREEAEKETEKETLSFGKLADDLFSKGGELEHGMTHYEPRHGQREMAETIYDAFSSNQHALIEAETGTGKSLAYLLPALYQSVYRREKVVVSTHLTQLQTQLLEKEIPMLTKMLPFSFSTALLKGKQHYISLQKFESELSSNQYDNYDITLTKAVLLVWLTETTTGDIDEIQLSPSGSRFFSRISSDTEGATDPRSPWFSRSFYQRARQRAQKADIIVTNHSLLCTDLVHQFGLLPAYKKVIIDEAHHLETTAAKHFGLKLDYVYVQYILNHLGSLEEGVVIRGIASAYENGRDKLKEFDWHTNWSKSKEETDDLFRLLFRFVLNKQKKDISVNDIGRFQHRFDEENEHSSEWQVVKEMASRLTFFLRDLIHILSRVLFTIEGISSSTHPLNPIDDLKEMMIKLQEIIDAVELMLLLSDDQLVKWAEIEAYGAKNAVYLYCEPVDVSLKLAENLFKKKESVVLTSATLTMKSSFEFIRKRLGVDEEKVIERKIASPYKYDQQVQLLVPDDFPDFKYGQQDAFVEAVCEAIYSLAEVTEGRMLVLFTSYEMLRQAYKLLKESMDTAEFMLIAQGVSSGSRERLKKNFQAFDKAILLGTSSFWEGVDIPGKDLSCLVMVRLPFQPPNHPVYEAKARQVKESGKNPFMELSLPNAVIRFKQGFGRLIRSSTDRGIVFVCDDRVIKARYGRYFIDSIPKVPLLYASTTELIEKAEGWL